MRFTSRDPGVEVNGSSGPSSPDPTWLAVAVVLLMLVASVASWTHGDRIHSCLLALAGTTLALLAYFQPDTAPRSAWGYAMSVFRRSRGEIVVVVLMLLAIAVFSLLRDERF